MSYDKDRAVKVTVVLQQAGYIKGTVQHVELDCVHLRFRDITVKLQPEQL